MMPSNIQSADGSNAEGYDLSSTGSASQAHDDRVDWLEHEILNCLGIVHLGTHILGTAREDKDKIAEWVDVMEDHRKQAVGLVKELAALARDDADDQQAIPPTQSSEGDQEV